MGKRIITTWKLVLTWALWLAAETLLMAAPYQLVYAGRLVDSEGRPLVGSFKFKVNFFRSDNGNDDVGVVVSDFDAVVLDQGIFQLAIALPPADFHAIFNGTDDAWIQLTNIDSNSVYPRQRLNAIPYALKVPVDEKTLTFDGNGALAIKSTGGIAGQVLSTDGAGNVSWASPGGGGDMLTTSNLSDLTDVGQARLNLGLGNGATADFGTGASDVARGNHTHTAAAISDFNTAVAAAPTVSTNTAKNSFPSADATKVGYLSVTQGVDLDAMKTITAGVADLSAVTSAATARTNLGLAALATKAAIASSDITDGAIANDDISASAAIAGTKVVPSFGADNISTTGVISGKGLGLTQLAMPAGYLRGVDVQYSNSTSVTITEGFGENNGKKFQITTPISHTVSSLAAAEDIHYIYIDDAASTYPSGIVIVDSTAEPIWDAAKNGWYNGNNRCLGAVYSPAASATIRYFQNFEGNIHFAEIQLQNDGAATDNWISTSANENAFIPVTAKSIAIRLCGEDAGSEMRTTVRPAGQSIYQFEVKGYVAGCFPIELPVNASDRSLEFNGNATDDDKIDIYLGSYTLSR